MTISKLQAEIAQLKLELAKKDGIIAAQDKVIALLIKNTKPVLPKPAQTKLSDEKTEQEAAYEKEISDKHCRLLEGIKAELSLNPKLSSRKLYERLRKKGIKSNHNTIAQLIKQHNLKPQEEPKNEP
jgi:hypothetical protein